MSNSILDISFEANPQMFMIELIEFLEKNKISLYGITLSRENLARIKKELMMRGINAA